MVRFKTKLNPVGQMYLPKEIRQELPSRKVIIEGDWLAFVFYPEDAPLESVVKSLEVILLDLKNRLELQKRIARTKERQVR
jgi:hypothetical protein